MLTYIGIAVLVLYAFLVGKYGWFLTTTIFVALVISVAAYFDYTFNWQDFDIRQMGIDFLWEEIQSKLRKA